MTPEGTVHDVLEEEEREDVGDDDEGDENEASCTFCNCFSRDLIFRRSRMRPGSVLSNPTSTPMPSVMMSTSAVEPCVSIKSRFTSII